MASLTIKTPDRNIKLRAGAKEKMEFFKSIEQNVANVSLGRMSRNIEKAYEDQVSIISTFFQRLIARTPLDERYERVIKTKDGEKIVEHSPDNEVCREHWYIGDEHSRFKLYSKNFIKQEGSFFVVNDSQEINEIKQAIKEVFPLRIYVRENLQPSFEIGNDCKHFAALEYGYNKWLKDSEPVVGKGGLEHGVKNKHSVQAPVGMLRITQAELEDIKKRSILGGLRRRYRGGYVVKGTPSKDKLKKFFNILKKGHRVKYADIKRYLEEYLDG